MCTILIAYQASEQWPLLVLANRDEFFSRPTAIASEWPDFPGMFAGQDLVSCGTWLGARNRRWATVTNVREGIRTQDNHQRSRGWLVRDYLQGSLTPADYCRQIEDIGDKFAGFNLLLGDGDELWYTSNRTADSVQLEPGIYGLSNHLLDTPWPKVRKGKAALKQRISQPPLDDDAAFAILTDQSLAADEELPDTGVPYEWEKALSAIFITMPEYGTRCSTLLSIDPAHQYRMVERLYLGEPSRWKKSEFTWSV